MSNEGFKPCSICGDLFPATPDYFARSSKSPDGLTARCKRCKSEDRNKLSQQQMEPITDDRIACALCGMICSNQVPASHLRAKHDLTTQQYREMGYETLSLNRRNQLVQQMQIAEIKRNYGADHPNFKGGHISGSGYKVISRLGHSNLYEHRVIAEQMVGRPLLPNEVVHHKDGNRLNNNPDNLQVMTVSAHNQLEGRRRAQRHHEITEDTVEAAHALHKLGWNYARIARALRCESSTISRWLNNNIT